MKDFGKGLLRLLLLKVVMNPKGLAILITLVVVLGASIFFFFPQSESFNLDDPDSNKDILNRSGSGGSFFASCSAEGEVNMELMEAEFSNAGVFTGKADMFIDVAERHNFDPVLLTAIAFHETGYGTSNMVKTRNNPGGLYNSSAGTFYSFSSLEEGLEAMTRNLAENYYGEGLFTIEEIGAKYAPIGVENDPTNLNAHWVPTITGIVNDLGGLIMHCEEIDSEFIFPLANPNVTSPFGYRVHPIEGIVKMHNGTDFGCNLGDPIYASNGGQVVYSGVMGGYGNIVVVEHPNSIFTGYAHLNDRTVNVGDSVQQGEQIGLCGSTGASTGPHLHFEVQLNQAFGQKVDPMEYLPAMSEN